MRIIIAIIAFYVGLCFTAVYHIYPPHDVKVGDCYRDEYGIKWTVTKRRRSHLWMSLGMGADVMFPIKKLKVMLNCEETE